MNKYLVVIFVLLSTLVHLETKGQIEKALNFGAVPSTVQELLLMKKNQN